MKERSKITITTELLRDILSRVRGSVDITSIEKPDPLIPYGSDIINVTYDPDRETVTIYLDKGCDTAEGCSIMSAGLVKSYDLTDNKGDMI